MADKGLVSKSTLQGFADEVRRLAESEQTGTPAEMLAILQAVEAGGFNVLTGEAINKTVNSSVLPLGTSFDLSGDYILMVGIWLNDVLMGMSVREVYFGYIMSVGGIEKNYMFSSGSPSSDDVGGYSNRLQLNVSTGDLTVLANGSTKYYFDYNTTYTWFFIKG